MAPSLRRFSPARGIFVDMTENQFVISGNAQVWGPAANSFVATRMTSALNSGWSRNFSDGYSTRCNVSVTYRAPGVPENADVLQIEYNRAIERSKATLGKGSGGEVIMLDSKDIDAITWVLVHEFGHTLGIGDRYTDEVRKINGTKQTVSIAHAGYETELMGAASGDMQSRTLQNLQSETAPSEMWINDDDQVRAWVGSHSAAELAAVTLAGRIRSLKTLMGGYISDEDVAAMEKIIISARTPDEAKTIRSQIDPLDMTSIGQRTRIRLAMARMP